MDLFSEVGLDMKVDVSSRVAQSQTTAPSSVKVIMPSSVQDVLDDSAVNGWDSDDLDI